MTNHPSVFFSYSYLRSNEHERRPFNQAIFHALNVEEGKITGHELKEPFARLQALQEIGKPHPSLSPALPMTRA